MQQMKPHSAAAESNLRRLALRVIEVGRHCDDGVLHGLPEVRFCCLLHLDKNDRPDLRRAHLLALSLNPRVAIVRFDDLVRVLG
jgi:hypothetical protein